MNANKKAKAAEVTAIKHKLEKSSSLVVVNYSGLTVKQFQTLRKDLKKAHVDLQVFKNRLVKVALKDTKYDALSKLLVGQNAYAFGAADDIAPAKIINNYAKEHEILKLIGGIYEHKVVDAHQVLDVAALPTHLEAIGILARQLISPLRYVAVGLDMLAKDEKHLAAPKH